MNDGSPRAAESAQTSAFASASPLAIPYKRRGIGIPARYRLLQPVNDLLGGLGMLTREGTAHDDALE